MELNGHKPADTIYVTTDYSRFSYSDLNRPIEPARVEFWKRALSTTNLLVDSPFLVSPAMEIIDGQHRLLAAQELGLPIYSELYNWKVRENDIVPLRKLHAQSRFRISSVADKLAG